MGQPLYNIVYNTYTLYVMGIFPKYGCMKITKITFPLFFCSAAFLERIFGEVWQMMSAPQIIYLKQLKIQPSIVRYLHTLRVQKLTLEPMLKKGGPV